MSTIETLEKLCEKRNNAASRVMETVATMSATALSLTIAFRERIAAGAACDTAVINIQADVVVLQKLIERLRQNDDLLAAAPPLFFSAAYYVAILGACIGAAALAWFGVHNI